MFAHVPSPSMTVPGRAATALLLAALLVPPRADAACERIVASRHAEYMVLDPGTLATLQVGDLHWLGIYDAGVIPESSLERTLVRSAFLRVNSETPMVEGYQGSQESSSTPLIYLENLGENLRSQDEIPAMYTRARGERFAFRWADWIQEHTFLREVFDWDGRYIAGYELLDTDFNVLRRWRPQVGFSLEYPSCSVDDGVYFAGGRGLHVFDDRDGTIYEWESLRNEGLRLVLPHTKNCRALAFRDTPIDDPMYGAAVVDIVGDTLGSEFAVNKGSVPILYDNGNRLLQQIQDVHYTFFSSGEIRSMGTTPTNRFNLIDTTTGAVLLERELDVGSGELSSEMLCDDETPRALVMDDDAFYLIDPNTLEVVASKAVPMLWGGFYYVFE